MSPPQKFIVTLSTFSEAEGSEFIYLFAKKVSKMPFKIA